MHCRKKCIIYNRMKKFHQEKKADPKLCVCLFLWCVCVCGRGSEVVVGGGMWIGGESIGAI